MKKPYSTNSRKPIKPIAPKPIAITEGETARPKDKDRIAKYIARAGLGSRRDVEAWILEGRVSVNGNVLTSPALNVSSVDKIMVDGKPLPGRERTRMWLYHKPRGLVTTEWDPEGRPTVFKVLPEHLPRVVSVGRLDINTEGLLLLTNDGALAGLLENPRTGWTRRYRVRAFGTISQDSIDLLAAGMVVDGIHYGPIECHIDRVKGENTWLIMTLTEGKNREIKNVLKACGLEVSRLIRVSYGPFQLRELVEGDVEEVPTRILQDQLGPRLIADANLDFTSEIRPPKLMATKSPLPPGEGAPKGRVRDTRGKFSPAHPSPDGLRRAQQSGEQKSGKAPNKATGKAARFASAQAENMRENGRFLPRMDLIEKIEPTMQSRRIKGENAKPRKGLETSNYEPIAYEPRPNKFDKSRGNAPRETSREKIDEKPNRFEKKTGAKPFGAKFGRSNSTEERGKPSISNFSTRPTAKSSSRPNTRSNAPKGGAPRGGGGKSR